MLRRIDDTVARNLVDEDAPPPHVFAPPGLAQRGTLVVEDRDEERPSPVAPVEVRSEVGSKLMPLDRRVVIERHLTVGGGEDVVLVCVVDDVREVVLHPPEV